MDINEKFFPQRMYFVEWNGWLKVYLRLKPTKFDIDNGGMPYADVNLLDCVIGEDWKIKDEQSAIDEYDQEPKKWYQILSKEYIEENFFLNKDDAISLSQERWKIYSPSGKSWDVVSYWDDCDRKVKNAEPLEYKDAVELCRSYRDKIRHGSLYHYTVEPHKFKSV